MVAPGMFLSVANDVIVLLRNRSLFVVSADSTSAVEFELLQEPEVQLDASKAGNDDDDGEQQPQQHGVPPSNRITGVRFFKPSAETPYALLLLVDDRKLVHYDVDFAAGSVTFRSTRALPRGATCMAVGHLEKDGERKHVVIVGVKTGEALAMPFPDIVRDIKTLLGHTTSMLTQLAVSKDSSLLLTADRDEKIRVSAFPRTSLIQTYCLGHAASLTDVTASSLTPELAVSTSLDNTIKLWDITSGELLASQELLKDEPMNSKNLLNASLAVSAQSNLVAVVLNNQCVRLFAIVTREGQSPALENADVSVDLQKQLNANEPCEACFTSDGALIVSHKHTPFVSFYSVTKKDGGIEIAPASLVDEAALTQLRTKFATIELAAVGDEEIDELEEHGLKKKKVKTEWKAKVLQ
ncbi:Wd repeat protein wdr4, partial [Globisporangium splendens]